MGKDIRALKKKLEKAVGEAKILMSKYHFSKLETFISFPDPKLKMLLYL